MASAVTKLTTGLAGMPVARHPLKSLRVLYEKTLKTLEKMPETAGYRKNTEKIIQERLKVVNSTTDVAVVEKKLNCGQAEELILQGERELILARRMLAWKPWEPLLAQPPPNQWRWPLN